MQIGVLFRTGRPEAEGIGIRYKGGIRDRGIGGGRINKGARVGDKIIRKTVRRLSLHARMCQYLVLSTLPGKDTQMDWFAKYKSSRDFVTLDAWKKARLVRIFFYSEIISKLPSEEKYNLSEQMRRASVSVTANISEGYGRYHHKEGIQFYRIARGSLYELKDHLITCRDSDYIDDSLFQKGIELIEPAKITLNGFIKFVEEKQESL